MEGVYRGLLLNFVATDAEVQDFEKRDVLPINMTEVAKAIDAKYKAGDFFEDLKKRSWSALCSYTHSAIFQLGRDLRCTGWSHHTPTRRLLNLVLLLVGQSKSKDE